MDGLKALRDLETDTRQSALDTRVELNAEGDRLSGGLADFEARLYAEINSLFRRLEELGGKVDQANSDLGGLMMMMLPYQQNIQFTLDDIAWHSHEQYGRSRIMDRAAENSGLALDNTRMLGEVSEEVVELLMSKAMIEELLARLLPPARAPMSQAHMPPPAHQASAQVPQASGGSGGNGPDPVPINLTGAIRFKSPPTSPPTQPATWDVSCSSSSRVRR